MKHLISALLIIFCPLAFTEYQVDIITDQLKRPWGLASLPDKRFLVTEKSGQLYIVDAQGQLSKPVSGIPRIRVVGQGGLLDVTLHPHFEKNKWIYLSYVAGSAQAYGTEVIRATLDDQRLLNIKKIFVAQPKMKGGRHFGSRLLFDKQGYLYISLGDRGKRWEAQNLKSHWGSIIRVHDDGRIPDDNPFVAVSDAQAEIYSYGHRNVQGLTLSPTTDEVWSHEHGPQGGDEVNVIQPGRNYGWPVITYGVEYISGIKIGEGSGRLGMEQPLHYWDPSIAPSGMAFFQNDLWVGALKSQLLSKLTFKGRVVLKEARLFKGRFGRIRDVEAADGRALYILTDSDKGQLVRITKK